MRRVLFICALVGIAAAARPKIKDHHSKVLIDLADVGNSCADSYTGYAIIDNSLEKCDNFTALQMGAGHGQLAYEEFKCKHLRVHGQMMSGKCVCKNMYEGPTCEHLHGCPADKTKGYNGVCTANPCQHGGRMAIGVDHMECICEGEWDGKHCDRLACWRLTDLGQDKRYRNDQETKSCKCGAHYEGEHCDMVKSCAPKGKFDNGVCECEPGYGGEICDRTCPKGQLTCSTGSIFSSLLALPILVQVINRLF